MIKNKMASQIKRRSTDGNKIRREWDTSFGIQELADGIHYSEDIDWSLCEFPTMTSGSRK